MVFAHALAGWYPAQVFISSLPIRIMTGGLGIKTAFCREDTGHQIRQTVVLQIDTPSLLIYPDLTKRQPDDIEEGADSLIYHMAEPNNRWLQLDSIFLAAYNQEHGADFKWTGSAPISQGSDRDYANSTGEIFHVQHTVDRGTNTDQLKERIIFEKVGRNLWPILLSSLAERGYLDAYVSLGLHNSPKTSSQWAQLSRFITEQLSNLGPPGREGSVSHYSLDPQSEDLRLEPESIGQWVASLSIRILARGTQSFLVTGYEPQPLKQEGTLDSVSRLKQAIMAKINKNYPDAANLVLLIEYEGSGINGYELPEMQEVARRLGGGFKAIWVVELWNTGSAHRLR